MASSSSGGRGGGRHQRRKRERSDDERGPTTKKATFTSSQAFYSVRSWAWGDISAPQLQATMRQAYDDQVALLARTGKKTRDWISDSLVGLARIGSWGRFHGNMSRDILSFLGDLETPTPFMAKIDLQITKPKPGEPDVQEVSFPFMLPHDTFNWIYEKYPSRFTQLFYGDTDDHGGRLESFWRGVIERKDPRLKRHCMCERPGWPRLAIPYSVHGDAVPAVGIGRTNTKSYDVYSFQGIFSRGSTRVVKLFMAGLYEQSKAKEPPHLTMDQIWKVLAWSFEVCFSGRWPAADHNGVPFRADTVEGRRANTELAGGRFLVLWCIKGDLDHFAKSYKLRHYAAAMPCSWCPGDTGPVVGMRWNNFRGDATWKRCLYSQEEWALSNPGRHALFRISGVTIHCLEADELHVVHLGTSAYMFGSILWHLCFECMPGSAADNCKELWSHITNSYSQWRVPCQFTNLSVSSFVNAEEPRKHYPKLRGSGSEVKDIAGPLLAAFQAFRRRPSAEHDHIEVMLDCQCQVQQILHDTSHDDFLSLADADRVAQLVNEILRRYTILANLADARGVMLYSVTPKFHWYYHWSLRARVLHPRKGNAAIDEDYVGYCKTIVQSCSNGTPSHRVPEAFVQKMTVAQMFLCAYGDKYSE